MVQMWGIELIPRYMQYNIDRVDPSKGPTYEKAKRFGQILIDNCESESSASSIIQSYSREEHRSVCGDLHTILGQKRQGEDGGQGLWRARRE